jgi:hypothetical protein
LNTASPASCEAQSASLINVNAIQPIIRSKSDQSEHPQRAARNEANRSTNDSPIMQQDAHHDKKQASVQHMLL